MLWVAGQVVTLDPSQPEVEAILERDGHIVALGTYSELRRQAPGEAACGLPGVVLPGLIDAHGHLALMGESFEVCDLSSARSASDVASRLASTDAVGGWIRGRAWTDVTWPSVPDARLLGSLPSGVLVALERVDSHALWVNQAVLDRAGIRASTRDPVGGRIERRLDGSPTGVLVDRAMEVVEGMMTEATDADLDRRLQAAADRCAAVGLVGVHDAGVDGPILRALLRLEAQGALPIRVYAMAREGDPEVEEVLASGPWLAGFDGRVTLRTVKFFLDGALGSRGAAFFDPYADAPNQRGLLLEDPQKLEEKFARRMRAGFQVAVHAIGDQANAVALDALSEAQRRTGRTDLRPRIEHAQHVRPSDIERFAKLGVIASMQPIHQRSDWPWAKARLGRMRWAGAYAWRSMLAAGVRLAFGSDFPIEDPQPLLGLAAATTHSMVPDEPDESIPIEVALHAFTSGAAYAAFEEHQSGVLRVGRRCDLTMLNRDPRRVDSSDLASLHVLGTVIGGQAHLR